MFQFALKTLVFERGKLFMALVGVVFSQVLVNVQGGLFLGLMGKASLLVDNCQADIWVGSRGVENVDFAYHLPEHWLNRIRGLPGVLHAEPYVVGTAVMTLPNGEFENVWLIGSEPGAKIENDWQFSHGTQQDLNRPESISIDELDAWKLGYPQVGDTVEINGKRARVVATTRGALGFLVTPYLFTSLDSARRYCSIPEGHCTYFLVKLSADADMDSVCAAIAQVVPHADVFPAKELGRISRNYWMARTGIGISFGGATILGILVGLVMVAQSLYAMTLDHLADYATLKAIGAEDRQVYAVLLLQAMFIALLGTSVGIGFVYAIKALFETPIAPIDLPWWLILSGVALNVLICLLSSVLPYRRIQRIDPAIVLQGWA